MDQARTRACNRLAVLAMAGAGSALTGCMLSQLPSHQGMVQAPPSSESVVVKWFTLPNGLAVAMLPDPHANLVAVDVRYQVGSAEDPPGKPGLAHLVEHLTYVQRGELDGPTLADRLQLISLDRNGYTTADATHFYSVALAPELDQLLALEATRLDRGCRGIDQATFDRERAIVALEINQRARPGAEAISAEVFGKNHPYAHSSGGSVAGLTLADACSFLDAHYAPDRAVLLVGGRFDPAALPAAVAARFGSLHHRARGALARVEPPSLRSRTSELRAPVAKPNALILLPAAPWGSSEALDETVLDDLVVQRLDALAVRQRWILGVYHGHLGGTRAAVRYISVVVSDPSRLDDASALVFKQASAIAGTSPPGVSGLIERRRAALLDGFESFLGRAQLCADALQFAGDRQCRLTELRELETEHTERVAMRASAMATGPRRVIRVLPAGGGGAPAELELPALDASDLEVPVWHSSVDPADADRPLALPAALHASDISEFSLANGLRVVMASNFTQPLVDIRLVFPVGMTGGSTRDVVAYGAGKLLRHDASRRYTPDDRATLRWLHTLGALLYVEVTDSTTFRIRGPAESADWHLWRLSWLVRDGVYSSRELSFIREAVAARSSSASNREPDGLARRIQAVREALYGAGHPYAHARDQEITARIASLTVEDLEQFRAQYYVPAGAALIIAGRFDPAAMRGKITELFDGWSAPAPPAQDTVPAMRPARGPSWIAYDDRSAAQLHITFDFVATSNRVESRAARTVLSEIVRGRVERVRTEMLASYGIGAGYWTSPAGDVLQIDGLVGASRAGEVLRRLLADLDKLRTGDDGLRGDFVRARRAALAAALADPSIPSATARRLQHAVTSHAGLARESLAAAIASTTLRDVARVIAEDLQPARMVGVLSGRPADTAAAMATAGITGALSIGDATAKR